MSQGPRGGRPRGGVLLYRDRAEPDESASDVVPPRHGAAAPRGPRLPAAACGQHPTDAVLRSDADPPVSSQAIEALAEAAQPQDAGVTEAGPWGEQEVPQSLRHGAQGAVVHTVQVEKGVLQVRRLIDVVQMTNTEKQ